MYFRNENPNIKGYVEVCPKFYIGLTKFPSKFHQIMLNLFFGFKFSKEGPYG